MTEQEENENGERSSAAVAGAPNIIYTQEELERLLGKAQARQIFELREAASRIHPTREEIAFAFKVCARTGPLPTAPEMRAAAPAFVAWLRATNASTRVKDTDKRSFDAFRAWIRLHYPEDYEAVVSARTPRRVRRTIHYGEAQELRNRGLKWCPECQTAKPIEDFNVHTNRRGKVGHQTYCRVCARARERARRPPALELPPVPDGPTPTNPLAETTPMQMKEGVTHGIQTRE